MVKIQPMRICGNWTDGFALDVHTISSTFIGNDEYGHPMFDTKRTEMGQLLLRLKYRYDLTVVQTISDTVAQFVRAWGIHADVAIPMPPSKLDRPFQPVQEITRTAANRLGLLYLGDCLTKGMSGQSKNVEDRFERARVLGGTFSATSEPVKGMGVLLLDDLYEFGTNLREASAALMGAGAGSVYVLTLTKTRK